MNPASVQRGSSPVILAMPHTGTYVPGDVKEKLNDEGLRLRDTDWHIDRLYAGLLPDATVVKANFHRYVIDANRDPSGRSLYPGQNTTTLVPTTDFDNQPIWNDAPDASDIARRLADWHTPYHAALEAEIARVKALHGVAILYDCHSIRSHCPFLFEGELPVLNIGTNEGATCAPDIAADVEAVAAASGLSWVSNGRFKGGWTTRHYGRPEAGIHAIQMEIAQSAYLASETEPFAYDEARGEKLRAVLKPILAGLEARAFTLGARP
jgi:formiminoglutamase